MSLKQLATQAGEANGWKRIRVMRIPRKNAKCRLPLIRGTDQHGVRWEAYVEPLGAFGPYTITRKKIKR